MRPRTTSGSTAAAIRAAWTARDRGETRIITVCDFYDALTADRPYRAAMPVDQALSVMAKSIGAALDPECFELLKAAIPRSQANGLGSAT